ncbi:MAG TPA: hypothetical protein PLZ38_07940 [Spirochaetota bacterium]|nr:hypothetical protein [Spirochaetota bacterium]
MRSKATNILQTGVLLTGIIYIIIGLLYGFSPIYFANIFGIEVNPDWYNLIKYDTFIAPLYHFSRIFALLLAIVGISMLLPLFDPLKYRGMIYYHSILFPLVSVPSLLINGITYDHLPLTICGSLLFVLFLFVGFGLIITRKYAKMGQE